MAAAWSPGEGLLEFHHDGLIVEAASLSGARRRPQHRAGGERVGGVGGEHHAVTGRRIHGALSAHVDRVAALIVDDHRPAREDGGGELGGSRSDGDGTGGWHGYYSFRLRRASARAAASSSGP